MRRCAASLRVDGVRAAMRRLACNVQSLQCVGCSVSCSPGALLHECDSLLQRRGAVRAFAMQLQLAVLASAAGLCPTGGASASLAAYGSAIRRRVVTTRLSCAHAFLASHGFWPGDEMANGSGRRHCASATTIGDCYVVASISSHPIRRLGCGAVHTSRARKKPPWPNAGFDRAAA